MFDYENVALTTPWYPSIYIPFCSQIQTYSLNDVVTIWDLAILIPNSVFLIYLTIKWLQMRDRLKRVNLPILSVFFYMIYIVTVLSILRCIVTIFIKPRTNSGEIINKIAWLAARLGQLSTELSVLFFGLCFSRLESRKSILRIIYITIPISIVYILIQGSMELFIHDDHYIVKDSTNHYYDLYGHGGMVFWFVSSFIFACIYLIIVIIPFTNLRNRFTLPTKRSFYLYCLVLGCLCIAQTVGSLIMYSNSGTYGMCLVDFTTYIYFTLHGPLVYAVFLRKFFQRQIDLASAYNIDGESASIRSNQISTAVTSPTSNKNLTIQADEDFDEYYLEDADSNHILRT